MYGQGPFSNTEFVSTTMTFRGPGYWLDWRTSQFDQVFRHDLWLCTPENAERFNVPAEIIAKLTKLHPFKDEDAIRILGLQAGLVRMRDQGNYFAVEFSAEPADVPAVLRAVEGVFAETQDRPWELFLFNLTTKQETRIGYDEFVRRLGSGEPVMATTEH